MISGPEEVIHVLDGEEQKVCSPKNNAINDATYYATGKVIYPKCYKNSNAFGADPAVMDVLTENFYNFAKVLRGLFSYFHGQNNYKISIFAHCIVGSTVKS